MNCFAEPGAWATVFSFVASSDASGETFGAPQHLITARYSADDPSKPLWNPERIVSLQGDISTDAMQRLARVGLV